MFCARNHTKMCEHLNISPYVIIKCTQSVTCCFNSIHLFECFLPDVEPRSREWLSFSHRSLGWVHTRSDAAEDLTGLCSGVVHIINATTHKWCSSPCGIAVRLLRHLIGSRFRQQWPHSSARLNLSLRTSLWWKPLLDVLSAVTAGVPLRMNGWCCVFTTVSVLM